ncbi:4'-phosphopantetheinyl transferase family protein [Flavihumibacter petaseus]|uniref:4'-phosphopantetheinyl transferase family protein n=1 Tax=Flavihumibacter petaseus TaxID=549295 RepID=UPI00061CEF9B|nr:4'-phosphopantetheinyl transferase superfamily protein [Flavihumibacter petaseus]
MALFYQHNINQHSRLAIWRIEEPEAFFLEKVPIKQDVTHPYKRLQHLAGRYLLRHLFADFPLEEIQVADTRKPFLPGEKYHFSISHSGNYAAAIASDTSRVGIDIELITPRIEHISHKFLAQPEKDFLDAYSQFDLMRMQLTTVIWSAKEALFKWYGNGKVDFRQHMQLRGAARVHANEWIQLPYIFRKEINQEVDLHAKIFNPLVLAYVIT